MPLYVKLKTRCFSPAPPVNTVSLNSICPVIVLSPSCTPGLETWTGYCVVRVTVQGRGFFEQGPPML